MSECLPVSKAQTGPRTAAARRGGSRVPTLVELSLRTLEKNVASLTSLGQVPYTLIRRVLQLCTSAQLNLIESHNLQILDESDELWKHHCLSEYADIRRANEEHPLSPESWRELYESKMREVGDREARLSARLRALKREDAGMKDARRVRVIENVGYRAAVGGSRGGGWGAPKKKVGILDKAIKASRKSMQNFSSSAPVARPATSVQASRTSKAAPRVTSDTYNKFGQVVRRGETGYVDKLVTKHVATRGLANLGGLSSGSNSNSNNDKSSSGGSSNSGLVRKPDDRAGSVGSSRPLDDRSGSRIGSGSGSGNEHSRKRHADSDAGHDSQRRNDRVDMHSLPPAVYGRPTSGPANSSSNGSNSKGGQTALASSVPATAIDPVLVSLFAATRAPEVGCATATYTVPCVCMGRGQFIKRRKMPRTTDWA
ncbi:RNA polymerase II transcription factor SIII subunit A-domain-containing protein [Entophlyctis helioformis]|nr:RNA polymerase II transcription factor SIII subunit A-domain-containing protein [Entophlyctis helioformis]